MKDFLQLFTPFYDADNGGGAGGNDPQDPPNDTDPQEPPATKTNEGGEKTFTQEDVDRLIKDRLAREKAKREKAEEDARNKAKQEALKEQEKFKELYEEVQKDLQAKQAEVLNAKKHSLLLAEGYTKEQADRYVKFVTGENEDEIAQAINDLKEDVPPKQSGVDPATQGNGERQQQQQEDPKDFGKELFARLKKSGKLRK